MKLPVIISAGGYIEGKDLCASGIGSALEMPRVGAQVFGDHPRVYDFAVPVALASFLLTAAVSLPHLRRLCCVRKRVLRRRARMFSVVASAPMVISLFKFSSVIMPRLWKVLFLGAAIYEVIAFWTFMRLICNMVMDDDVDNSDARVLKELQEGAPSKFWAVPPFACCFKPLVPARKFAERDFVAVRFLMWQFVIITPLVALADWSEAIGEESHFKVQKVEVLSLVLAMYALFCLLDATSERLHAYHSHSKFWTIKGIFIANTFTFRITSMLVEKDLRVGEACYSREAMASAWAGMVTSALALPLAALSRHAYPLEECVDGAAGSTSESDGENNLQQDGDGSPSRGHGPDLEARLVE